MTKKEGPLVIMAFEQYEWVEVTKEQLGERPLLVIFRRSMSTQMGHGQYFSAEEWSNIVKVHNKRLAENTRYKCLNPAPKKEKSYPLDECERKYLRTVLRPFKDRIDFIGLFKLHDDVRGDEMYISVRLRDDADSIHFPTFEEGMMYTRMTVGKQYTPEELGLWQK